MSKQILLDILIVLVAPIALIAGYLYSGVDLMSSFFPSPLTGVVSLPGESGEEMGAKSKAALNKLSSIHFDEAFFADPIFLSLVDFTGTISTTTVGREYPFSIPDEVRVMLRRSSKAELTAPATNASTITTPAVKIEAIKKVIK